MLHGEFKLIKHSIGTPTSNVFQNLTDRSSPRSLPADSPRIQPGSHYGSPAVISNPYSTSGNGRLGEKDEMRYHYPTRMTSMSAMREKDKDGSPRLFGVELKWIS